MAKGGNKSGQGDSSHKESKSKEAASSSEEDEISRPVGRKRRLTQISKKEDEDSEFDLGDLEGVLNQDSEFGVPQAKAPRRHTMAAPGKS
jgi:hypothetical protein